MPSDYKKRNDRRRKKRKTTRNHIKETDTTDSATEQDVDKGKLETIKEEDACPKIETFDDEVSGLEFVVVPVSANGDCCFISLYVLRHFEEKGDLLDGTSEEANEGGEILREVIATYMEQHKDFTLPRVQETISDLVHFAHIYTGEVDSWEKYLEEMRGSMYAGQPEICVFEHLANCNVVVYRREPDGRAYCTDRDHCMQELPTFYLLNDGNGEESSALDHFSALLCLNDEEISVSLKNFSLDECPS